jgi:hypothetical protein
MFDAIFADDVPWLFRGRRSDVKDLYRMEKSSFMGF